MSATIVVDLGKTGCRAQLRLGRADPAPRSHEALGAPGLAAHRGVAAARDAVCAAVSPLLNGSETLRLSTVLVGAAGAATAPEAARALAGALLAALPADEVAVTSDAIIAHAGALGARPGVVLSVGTGSVTIGVGADGTFARVGGWGPWLGDEGGGAWIGAAGLRAALRAHDGRGPVTRLLAMATDRFGDPQQLPTAIETQDNPARASATFAPDVARAADAGDPVAVGILADAATALASAVLTARRRVDADNTLPVAITGGLVHLGEPLLRPLRTALGTAPPLVTLQLPLGDSLQGAHHLAHDTTTPHEAHVARVRDTSTATSTPPRPAVR
ncbi:BadF/BadG/BcrA/BcrD ATPase family protein [Mycolicibacterium smegmatis]|uniref:BadF/BadG/BcrA/BcrD ATPase family protein n=1 Tax=Mycolicibacterium smegmatis (strain MKD8) TaxID=1214915 RepID=A0A2U9PHK8_MYCSE|nr:BadF/BadG/BcrA/BcrD ATPase family protein [Mycolicibacterium smegmatis]AWT51188.1 BadF/BadG/BcrA/BcrD ATPase family protein [Mycolicibacterium smegmatis MKD8]